MAKAKAKGSSSKAAKEQSRAAACLLEDFLFLGPASAASDAGFLTAKAITHVLSIGQDPPKKLDLHVLDPVSGRTTALQYHRLRLVDAGSSASSLQTCVDAASALLERFRSEKGRVLVHGSAGISRSPAVAVGYMMRHHGKTLKEALHVVVSARPAVSPNPEFIGWLKEEEIRLFGRGTLSVDRLPARQADRLALLLPGPLSPEQCPTSTSTP
ncbi:phosphatases II [Pilatotrama ljubarskyi]|nr:phosphatases II [Pilatotrama ljubarskyi]